MLLRASQSSSLKVVVVVVLVVVVLVLVLVVVVTFCKKKKTCGYALRTLLTIVGANKRKDRKNRER